MTSQMALCVKTQADSKQWSRVNGWSFPWHRLQVLAWIFLLMFAMLYFGVLVPSLPTPTWQISCATINGFVFLCHVILHIISISLNPADPNVRAKNYRGPLPEFNRSQHSHVIENQYCYICEVKVGMKSKHCSACNKCVSSFDHHCKWLNNCIGGRNYKLFILCVASALIGCVFILVTSIVLIAEYFNQYSWLNQPQKLLIPELSTLSPYPLSNATLKPNSTMTISALYHAFRIQVPAVLWLSLVVTTCVLSLIAVCLLVHLLGFHFYLMCLGLSTYDYIVQKRDSNNSENNEIVICSSTRCKGTFLKQHLKKANQITPALKGSVSGAAGDNVDELELKPHQRRLSPSAAIPVLTVSNENNSDRTLESVSGNVYLGSPHRQRQFLEPLFRQQKKNKVNNLEDLKGEESPQKRPTDLLVTPVVNGGLLSARKRHLSASQSGTSTLAPIFESDSDLKSGQWHRSISSQSLNLLDELDGGGAMEQPTTQLEQNKRINSSLSNLLFSPSDSGEEINAQNDEEEPKLQNGSVTVETRGHMTRCLSQNDMRLKIQAERRRLSIGSPREILSMPKNNFFPIFRPAGNSNVVRIKANRDMDYGSLERLDVYDSVVFDTQRSSANSTPVL